MPVPRGLGLPLRHCVSALGSWGCSLLSVPSPWLGAGSGEGWRCCTGLQAVRAEAGARHGARSWSTALALLLLCQLLSVALPERLC